MQPIRRRYKKRGQQNIISEEEKNDIIKMSEHGLHPKTIHEITYISINTIWKIIKHKTKSRIKKKSYFRLVREPKTIPEIFYFSKDNRDLQEFVSHIQKIGL